MVATDQVKEALRKKGPLTVRDIAVYIATMTNSSCDETDVMEALDDLVQVREVKKNGNQYSLA